MRWKRGPAWTDGRMSRRQLLSHREAHWNIGARRCTGRAVRGGAVQRGAARRSTARRATWRCVSEAVIWREIRKLDAADRPTDRPSVLAAAGRRSAGVLVRVRVGRRRLLSRWPLAEEAETEGMRCGALRREMIAILSRLRKAFVILVAAAVVVR